MTTATMDRSRVDVAFTALVSGAYASAVTALLFLLIDAARGQLFYTPSLLGGVVLLGFEPASTAPVRMDMGAIYSLIHLGVFVLIGGVVSTLHASWERVRSPWVLGAIVMAGLSAGALLVDAVLYPGLIGAIGGVGLFAGNAAAAATMTWIVTRAW
jgi:hypothetical protein